MVTQLLNGLKRSGGLSAEKGNRRAYRRAELFNRQTLFDLGMEVDAILSKVYGHI